MTNNPDPINHVLQFFKYEHLPIKLQSVSQLYAALATELVAQIGRSSGGPELTVALRKLLESKDAAVRAKLVSDNYTG
jgi:hypothetical protein